MSWRSYCLAPCYLMFSLCYIVLSTLLFGGCARLACLGAHALRLMKIHWDPTPTLKRCYRAWVQSWRLLFLGILPTRWRITTPDAACSEHIILTANHRSWSDIPLLLAFMQPQLPHMHFVMKSSLRHMPLIGWFCLQLGYVFVDRPTASQIRRQPELKGRDAARLQKALMTLQDEPSTLALFPEGTRFRRPTHDRQVGHPHAKGIQQAFEQWQHRQPQWLDVTLCYHGKAHFLALLAGLIPRVSLDARYISVNTPSPDASTKAHWQAELKQCWQQKNQRLLAPRTQHCLLVMPAWIGDAIMAHALVKKLHAQGYELTALAPDATQPVLSMMPEITTTQRMPWQHGQLALFERWIMGFRLRHQGFDKAIILPNSWKSAIVPWAARIPHRQGWLGECRVGLLNDWQRLRPTRFPLMVQRYEALADAFQPTNTYTAPTLQPSQDAHRALLASYPALGTQQRFIGLAPGAAFGPAKQWPAEFYADLATLLTDEGFVVVLFGGPCDITAAEIITAACSACLNLVGQTSLEVTAAGITHMHAMVANDSGLMHLSAALDRPVVAIYGPTSASFAPPLSSKARPLEVALPCRPCRQRQCPLEHHQCMRHIQPKDVLKTLHQLIGEP